MHTGISHFQVLLEKDAQMLGKAGSFCIFQRLYSTLFLQRHPLVPRNNVCSREGVAIEKENKEQIDHLGDNQWCCHREFFSL